MTLLELLPFVAVALAFWLLILRPAKQRRDAQARLVASLAAGQRVMTAGGIFGTVRSVQDGRVTLEVAPGVAIELVAPAIAEILPEPAAGASAPGGSALGDATDQPATGDPAPPDPASSERGPGPDAPTTGEADRG
jgi:preprotein translocase subunit YajC